MVPEVIRFFDWNGFYEGLREWGLKHIDETAAKQKARLSIDKHIISKRIMPDELPDFLLSEARFLAVQHAQIFHVSAGALPMIHVDGVDRHCALNVPLRGANQGLMEWFDYPFEPYVYRGDNTISTVTMEEVHGLPRRTNEHPFKSIRVFKPCVVRTNVWHRIDNRENPQDRYVLSLRFKDNPTFEHIVRCLTPVEEL